MSETDSRVETIWLKRYKSGPMDAVGTAVAVAGQGLEGNAEQGGKRQVTLLSADRWADVRREMGIDVDPSLRQANLFLSGIDFVGNRGRTLRIGPCRIRINGETKPCLKMERAQPGLQAALREEWRGGAYGEVLDDGTIRVGDPVVWCSD